MAPLSLTVADVRELDDGGGVGHRNLPVTAGNSFSWRPVSIGKIQPASFGLFLPSLFAIPVSLFAGPYLFSHCTIASQDFLRTLSRKYIFHVFSFRRLFLPPSHFAN